MLMFTNRVTETEFSSPDSRDARNGKKTRFLFVLCSFFFHDSQTLGFTQRVHKSP